MLAVGKDMSWLLPARSPEALPGRGLQCWLPPPRSRQGSPAKLPGPSSQDVRVLIGNRALLHEHDIVVPQCATSLQELLHCCCCC